MGARGERGDAQQPAARAVRALVDVEVSDAQPERLDGFGRHGRQCGPWRIQCGSCLSEFVALGAIAQESIVADAHEALGQHVQEIAADELLSVERHHLATVAVGVVLVMEAHRLIIEADEAVVGERDAMGVATEILEHLLGTSEGAFGVDHPRLGVEIGEEGGAASGVGEERSAAAQAERAALEGVLERGEELAARHLRERFHREEEAAARVDPAPLAPERPAAHQAVHVQVLREALPPSVQYRRDTDLAAQPARVPAELDEGLGRRVKEQPVDHAGVAS